MIDFVEKAQRESGIRDALVCGHSNGLFSLFRELWGSHFNDA